MSVTNADWVTKAYTATLFRLPNTGEMDYWVSDLDNKIITPTSLILLGIDQPSFLAQNLPIGQVYYTLFNSHMPPADMLIWGQAAQTGATLEQIAGQMMSSPEFVDSMTPFATPAERIDYVYERVTGEPMDPALLEATMAAIYAGELTVPQVVVIISTMTSPVEIGLGLIYSSVNNTAATNAAIETLDMDNIPLAVSEIVADYEAQQAEDGDGLREENGALLFPSEGYEGALSINLTTDQIVNDETPLTLTDGDLADVITIDARDLSTDSLVIVGDSSPETFYAANQGTTSLTGGNGDDRLYGGNGQDTFVFAGDVHLNGYDRLFDFQIGTGGDVLDFSKLLNQTDTSNIATQLTDAPNNQAWSNGQVLVAQGYGLNGASSVAGLFNQNEAQQAVFAAPSQAGKAVLITSDIVGSADIWGIVNQTDVTEISADEVTLLGSIEGLNNLSLVGFSENNFA